MSDLPYPPDPNAPPAGSPSFYGAPPPAPSYPPPDDQPYPPVYPPPQPGYPDAYPYPPQGGVYPPPQGGGYPPPQGGGYPPPPQNAPCAPGYGGSAVEPSEQRGSGGGLFSGKGLLGKAMKLADKHGAGNLVGQAAGALGLGGGGHVGGPHGAGGQHAVGGQHGGGQYGGGYQPQPASPGYPGYPPDGGYQASQYPGNYPPPTEQAYQGSPLHAGGGLLSNCRGTKKALLIGINYFGQRGELRGCINDVKNVKNLIMSRGFHEGDMVILTDDQRDPQYQPTRENIIEGMLWLVEGARPNDSLFFHYSGHGSQSTDYDGDEVDGSDETICPVDYKDAGEIVDDEMNALLVQQLPQGARLTAIFDSCHSATALDLPFVYDSYGQPKQQKYSRKTAGMDLLESGLQLTKGNIFDKLSGAKQAFSTIKALGNEGNAQDITAETRSTAADVVMFSGCKDYQTSADTNVSGYGATGAASFAFVNAVNSGGDDMTYTELLATMRETLYGKYEQKIQMSTGFPTDMNIPFIF